MLLRMWQVSLIVTLSGNWGWSSAVMFVCPVSDMPEAAQSKAFPPGRGTEEHSAEQ